MRENLQDRPLESLIQELPPELRAEVRDFVEFLIERRLSVGSSPLRQDWAGALRGYRHQYTSLGLQKNANEWRES